MADLTGAIVPTVEEVISSRRDNSNYSELRFPDDLGPHSIVLNFSDYSYDRAADKVSTVTSSSICLPIPANLQENFSLRYNRTELGAIGDLTRSVVGTVAQSESIEAGINGMVNSGELSSAVAVRTIKAALASTDSALIKAGELALGGIVNPHLALTFEGIDLKAHQFTWQLAPETSSESVRLAKIIKTIKRSILPSFSSDTARTFLKYPKVVDVFFLGSEPGFLYFFKRCMVTDFQVNYAPNDVPAFLPNGRPAFVTLTMSLSEMEIHTAEDYTGDTNQ